jgi:hypothetical protein
MTLQSLAGAGAVTGNRDDTVTAERDRETERERATPMLHQSTPDDASDLKHN